MSKTAIVIFSDPKSGGAVIGNFQDRDRETPSGSAGRWWSFKPQRWQLSRLNVA